MPTTFSSVGDVAEALAQHDYLADEGLATSIYLAVSLRRPLLLEGEGNSRRDYVYIYEGPVLRSVVKQEFKIHLPPPGVPGAAAPVFNLLRDPREMTPQVGYSLWSGASFQDMIKRHMITIKQYPHLPLGKGVPYEGIENLRPESEKAREVFASWQPPSN